MSGASPSNAFIPNSKTGDSGEESAVTSIAATGLPPLPHKRAVIVARRCSFGHGADRMARYKNIRQRTAARTMRGASCERDARLDTLRAPACHSLSDWTHDPRPSRQGVHSRIRLNSGSIAKGDTPPSSCRRRLVCALERDSDRLAPRRLRVNGRPLSAPPPGPRVPTAWLRKELRLMAMSHQREAIWRTRQPYLGAFPQERRIVLRIVVLFD